MQAYRNLTLPHKFFNFIKPIFGQPNEHNEPNKPNEPNEPNELNEPNEPGT